MKLTPIFWIKCYCSGEDCGLMRVYVYLVSSILAVFAVFADVMLQLLDLQLDLIVLFSELIGLSGLCLER